MEAKKQNPILTSLINVVPGVLNSVVSVVRDKRQENLGSNTELVQDKIADGVSISMKRVANLGVTGAVTAFALAQMAENGITWMNLAVLSIGAAYSFGMTWLTKNAEQPIVDQTGGNES